MDRLQEIQAKYAARRDEVVASGKRTSDFKPGDKAGWFPNGPRKRALWVGTIERLWTNVHVADGTVAFFTTKADFKAPSWSHSIPVDVNELESR